MLEIIYRFLGWPTDRKIQFLILVVLTLTLLYTVAYNLFEAFIRRKKIKFLSYSIKRIPRLGKNEELTRVTVRFANSGGRMVHTTRVSIITYIHGIKDTYNPRQNLQEGDDIELVADFTGILLEEDPVWAIQVVDSWNKKWTRYVYRERFRSRLTVGILRLKDTLLRPLHRS